MADRSRSRRWAVLGLPVAAFIIVLANESWWESALRFLFPDESIVLHARATPLVLVGEHVLLVAVSSLLTIIIGVPLGIWVTRPSGASFLPIITDLTSFGQTFPPVAVLAISVPMLGFGAEPTILALFLYGLLPVVRNTIAGLRAVPPPLTDAARGMGMTRSGVLFRIELPLAARVILAGIRTSVVINIGTAMIGAFIGAGGLGSPIVAGLVYNNNMALIIEGALPAAVLAVLVDQLLANVEAHYDYPVVSAEAAAA